VQFIVNGNRRCENCKSGAEAVVIIHSVLQCVAACGSVLQCVAACGSVLQCVAVIIHMLREEFNYRRRKGVCVLNRGSVIYCKWKTTRKKNCNFFES